jgi:ABC-type transport system substrate-binding protein
MSDPNDVSRSKGPRLSRRTMLRLGLLAVPATQVSLGGVRVAADYYDYTGTKLVPNIARAWEVSRDGKTTTLLLRRGMRWSDGQPFTADDFVFWYEDVYQNKDLVPTPLSVMTIGGKPIAIR